MTPPPPLDWEDIPGGPAAGTVLARLDEIPPDGAHCLSFEEGSLRFEGFIQRRDELVVAYENSCPHARLPLDWTPGRFLDVAKRHIRCANHGARFRIIDGYCVSGPCKGRYLRALPIRVVDNDIIAGI